MTATLFPEAAPPAGPRVTITARPKGQGDPVLSLGRFDTPLGTVVAMGRGGALWGLGFAGELSARQVEEDLLARWPRATKAEAPETLAPAIEALLTGRGEIAVELSGTPFQIQVWRALADIPAGRLVSYAALAKIIARPRALRAVGTAVGQNPVSWAIPATASPAAMAASAAITGAPGSSAPCWPAKASASRPSAPPCRRAAPSRRNVRQNNAEFRRSL